MPASPGVYLMKDGRGVILYVGKASSLRHRVSSYFSRSHRLEPHIRQMVGRIADIEFYITASEEEALILELNLIKRYSPLQRAPQDDKSFPYLKIDTRGLARVQIVPGWKQRRALLRPFASAKSSAGR